MKLLHGFDESADFRGGYVAIGNFDGVHRGHQAMAAALVAHARRENVPAVVFTFDPHPIKLLRPSDAPPRLSTLERKAELLERCGVDVLIAYPTDHALLSLTPEEFFADIVRNRLDARGLVEGPNFFFGHNRAGNVDTLSDLCRAAGMTLDVVPAVSVGDRLVSSSTIRELVAAGNLREAVELLGHPYQIRGRVVNGDRRGRALGFPTANLDDVQTLLPPDGVYVGRAAVDGAPFPAAVNLGPNPTFGEGSRKLEVHVVDFDGELYGRRLHVDLLAWLRDIRTFRDADALRDQLRQDVAEVRRQAAEFHTFE